jgi:hypothetical protein
VLLAKQAPSGHLIDTALLGAVKSSTVEVVDQLLTLGADINTQDEVRTRFSTQFAIHQRPCVMVHVCGSTV